LAVPSYHRILVKHGLIEKTLSLPDAYSVFLIVGADPEVQKLRRKVERGNKMKHVPALYCHSDGSARHDEAESLNLEIADEESGHERHWESRRVPPYPPANYGNHSHQKRPKELVPMLPNLRLMRVVRSGAMAFSHTEYRSEHFKDDAQYRIQMNNCQVR